MHNVSISLQTQCLGREELLDDLDSKSSNSVIEAPDEVNEVGFFLVVRLASFRAVRNWRENVRVRLNCPSSRVTGITVAIGFQTGVFFKWLFENSISENLLLAK
jgi:hypothetical protein